MSRIIRCLGSEACHQWFKGLQPPQQIELYEMLLELPVNTQDNDIVKDWIEDYGGDPAWERDFLLVLDEATYIGTPLYNTSWTTEPQEGK